MCSLWMTPRPSGISWRPIYNVMDSETVADTAEEGVRVAREDRPDLVLMDVVFRGMSGYHATRRISRNWLASRPSR